MSLECKCDECNRIIDTCDDTVCRACYDKAIEDIKSLEIKIEELESMNG